ncbi:MAG: PBECR2 nuclease fold domain-containing protein [Roseburia sp.]|nr:PBECR2 nuclease fold domain-containing protein [Roseburia sp.]
MLEQEIMSDVVRRIQKAGKITSTADWQLQRYMVLGHSTEDVENIVRSAVGGDYVDTFRLYDEVIETEYVRSKAMYEQVNAHFTPYEQNYELQQLTSALIQQSNDELFNISKSLGFMVDMGNGRKVFTPLSEIYSGYLDNAITMMASGAYDYNTLIRKVVGQMTASGLRTVDYASGHSNRVDVAVRRALLTGMGQLTGRISDMNGQNLGTDQFEVDWHPGARPDHAVWQGRVWRKEQLYSVCGLGTGPGLLGWNCRHSYYPFIPGVSVRNYSDDWLEAKAREEAEKKPFRGKEYNLYEATQKQRQMETAMRAQREKVKLLQQANADKDDIINAKCKYQAQLDEYAAFSKKFNLPEQRERIYYDLRGRVAPSQRTYKKWQAEQTEKAAKRTVAKERKAERAMRERAETNRRADMDNASKSAIIRSSSAKEEIQVHLVGKINKEIYKCITDDIVTDEVVITDNQIQHIKNRHPNDYERFSQYFSQIVKEPDYIIEANKPDTAVILKEIIDNGEKFQTVLRLCTSKEPEGYKNSIITFLKIDEKRWKRYLRTKNILYKKE